MLQGLRDFFHTNVSPIFTPTHKDNVLLITAYPKKGVVTLSYKGEVKTAKFTDNSLRNMMKGNQFHKNAESFLGCLAHLLEQLILPPNVSTKEDYLPGGKRAR